MRAAALAVALPVLAGCSEVSSRLSGWIESTSDHPFAPLVVIGVFVASGFVAAPLSLVMVPTIVVFGPLAGSLLTAAGATLSGALFFWLGSRGVQMVGRLRPAGAASSRLGALVGRNGIAAVAIARNLPLGPYPLVNLALGASPVTLPHFLVGNLLGLAPWIALYALAGAEIRTLAADPSPGAWLGAGLALVAILAATAFVRHRFLREPTAVRDEIDR